MNKIAILIKADIMKTNIGIYMLLLIGCFSVNGQVIPNDSLMFKLDRNNDNLDFEMRIRSKGLHKGKVEVCYWTYRGENYYHGVGYYPEKSPVLVKRTALDSINWLTMEWFEKILFYEYKNTFNILLDQNTHYGAYILDESLCDLNFCLLYPAHITAKSISK